MKLKVKKYNQRSDEWKYQKLGDSSLNFGDYGCLVTCCSMVLDYYGKDLNPRHLNEVLKRIMAFNDGYLKWSVFADHFNFTFGGVENFHDTPAPVDRIIKRIDEGHPTIIKVDFIPETRPVDMHFVLVVGYTDDDLIVNDPWTGEEYFLTAKYHHTNNRWNQPKYVIYGIRELTPNFETVDDKDDLQECLKAHKDAMDALKESENREKQLRGEIDEVKKKNEELKDSIESLTSHEKELNKEIENLTEKNDELSRMNKKINGTLQYWQGQAETAKKEVKDLKDDLKYCREACKDWENKANLGLESYKSKELLIEIIGRFLGTND